MTFTSFPFENADTTETQFSYLFRELQDPGVVGAPGDTNLQVSTTTALGVSVGLGRALLRGFMLSVTTAEPLTLAAANATNPRIDRVVVRADPANDGVVLAVLTGTPAVTPVAPTLTQTDTGVFEVSLAQVRVEKGQTTLSASNVADERTYLGGGVIPWTSATRPASPVIGRSFGFNNTTNAFEYWNGTQWVGLLNALDASKITTGTVPPARLPLTTGTVTVNIPQLNSSGTATINFPAGKFAAAPTVIATVGATATLGGGTPGVVGVAVTGVTATSATVTARFQNSVPSVQAGTATGTAVISWVAIGG